MKQIRRNRMPRHYRFMSMLAAVAMLLVSGFPVAAPAAETLTFIHTDALGSPVAATDQQGNVIWREEYKPYGERLKNEVAAQTNTRWFTGHPHDAATGLTYMGARYYDAVVGRFMGVDPLPFEEGMLHSFNRYVYGANNPYKFVDPDGRRVLISGHVAAGGFGYLTGTPSYHLSIVLIPDRPQDFKDRTGWTAGADGTLSATLGGQPTITGILASSPNNAGDRLENGTFQQDVPPPQGMSDTEFINRLINSAGSYKNNLRYELFPKQDSDGFNSNSYISGVLRTGGAAPPSLNIPRRIRGLPSFDVPGYDKPIPLEPYTK